MKQLAIDALRYRYEAQKKSAKYTLTNYFQNPAAIGEHPDLLEAVSYTHLTLPTNREV